MNARTRPTTQQQQAIDVRGNVLVVAGAGAGKTRTLVERCLAWLAQGGSVDEMLMVTFTQAAAAEMRQRLRLGLENSSLPSGRLAEQSALLDAAHICTLHSFCLRLVSEHFYELGLDPQLKVFSEEESRLLASEVLDELFEGIYQSQEPAALEIQRLILSQGADGDRPVRELIGRAYRYSQTLRDAKGWLAAQRARFESTGPVEWEAWLMEELRDWRSSWQAILRKQPAQNVNAAVCRAHLDNLGEQPRRVDFARALGSILLADKADWPKPRKNWRDPIEALFDEAKFLQSVCLVEGNDPLIEDWNWVRSPMLALLDAAERFARAFADAKRRAGGIDYHDLEQFALQLLWVNGQPTTIARQWRQTLRLVFVDEFQDINGAQEAIIEALSRDGAEANRFLVGDVKQSIYRFRLADPGIFIRYKAQWEKADGASVLGLSENFRSHEAILNFVNAVFSSLMRLEVGGVSYGPQEELRFGAREQRADLAARTDLPPPVEWHLRCQGGEEADESDSASAAEKEARLVGRRLLQLRSEAEWSDMVVLLRSRTKTEAYVKEFNRLGIPLAASRGGFYDVLEITDLLSMLQVLDNPLQDLPLLAVLHSPLAGFAAADLAVIRAAHPRGKFWTALVDWQRANAEGELAGKAKRFVSRFRRWRRQARQGAVSQCLESILDETCYRERLLALDRGEWRRANVEKFVQMARQFDAGRGGCLSRFVASIEAQQESDTAVEPAALPHSNAVRLMTIHQSKGLEFPIVAVADLGKRFNLSDLWGRIIFDEKYGLSPQARPPDLPRYYPTLPWWLAQRRQRRELLGEELRLLYVAMTRAARRLLLFATVSEKNLEEKWPKRAEAGLGTPEILSANSCMEWLGPWLARHRPDQSLFQCAIYNDDHPALSKPEAPASINTAGTDDISEETRARLEWRYPFVAETQRPAKLSVSVLRRQIAEEEGEATNFFAFPREAASARMGAADVGSAHHLFLEHVTLENAAMLAGLKQEAARLRDEGSLTAEQSDVLDFDALAAFWQSEIGRQVLEHSGSTRRELAFTARFSAEELASFGSKDFETVEPHAFVVVQGAIDLAVLLPVEIWILDFKTDKFGPAQLEEKTRLYKPQLEFYATALSRIYQRPVTRRWLHFLPMRLTILV